VAQCEAVAKKGVHPVQVKLLQRVTTVSKTQRLSDRSLESRNSTAVAHSPVAQLLVPSVQPQVERKVVYATVRKTVPPPPLATADNRTQMDLVTELARLAAMASLNANADAVDSHDQDASIEALARTMGNNAPRHLFMPDGGRVIMPPLANASHPQAYASSRLRYAATAASKRTSVVVSASNHGPATPATASAASSAHGTAKAGDTAARRALIVAAMAAAASER